MGMEMQKVVATGIRMVYPITNYFDWNGSNGIRHVLHSLVYLIMLPPN